jgi:hypothetical protein
MEGFLILLGMAALLLILDVAAVARGAKSRESFMDERLRPSVG